MDNMERCEEDLEDFDPMTDHFNTEDNYFPRGPDNRRPTLAGQRSAGHVDHVRLHIGKIPPTLSEKGLHFLLNKVVKPVNLYLVQSPGKYKFGFAEYISLKDALCVIQKLSGVPPHNLFIDFANPVRNKEYKSKPGKESICARGSLSDVNITSKKYIPDESSLIRSKINTSSEFHETDTSLSPISIESKSQDDHSAAVSQCLKNELLHKDSTLKLEQSKVPEQPEGCQTINLCLESQDESPQSEFVKSKERGIFSAKVSRQPTSTQAFPGLVKKQVSPTEQKVLPRAGVGRGKWLLESLNKARASSTIQCSPAPKMTSEPAREKLDTHLNFLSGNSWGVGRGILKKIVSGMLDNERQGSSVYCHNPVGFNRPLEYGYCNVCGRLTGQHCSVCHVAVCSMSCAPSISHHSSDSEGNLVCLGKQ